MYPKMPLKTMVVSCCGSHQLTRFPAPSCLAWPAAPPSVPSKCLFRSHRSNSRWRAGLLAGWKDGGRRGGDGDGDRVLSYHMLSGSQRFVGEQFGRGGRWSGGRAREGTRWSRGGYHEARRYVWRRRRRRRAGVRSKMGGRARSICMFSWVHAFAALSGQQAADRATEAWAQLYCGDGEGRGAEGGKACSYRSCFPVACDPQLLCGGQERGGAGMTVGWRGADDRGAMPPQRPLDCLATYQGIRRLDCSRQPPRRQSPLEPPTHSAVSPTENPLREEPAVGQGATGERERPRGGIEALRSPFLFSSPLSSLRRLRDVPPSGVLG